MRLHRGLNYFANCGPYFATEREVRRPCSDNGSNHGDQTTYRTKIALYFEAWRAAGWPTSVAPEPYVPPDHPNCTRWCRNGWHDPACSERV